MEKNIVINPNDIKSRDYLVYSIINGVTKANIQTDRKKENSKKNCRRKVDINSEE